MFHGLTLLVPDKADSERDAVARAWETGGGTVLRLGRFWSPPEMDRARVRLYGNDTFCLVLAQKLGVSLVSPPDDLLLKVDSAWVKREVRGATLAQVMAEAFPRFIKPLVPKVFRAAVWPGPEALAEECRGLAPDTPVLSSEIVSLRAEARAWVLDGRVRTCAVYEGTASVTEAEAFLASVAREAPLPRTCVLDVALVEGRGWALLEANAAWGAGLNGCDAAEAARCIAEATVMA
ncbi:ATP-grasp domain-containing protein [Pyxidicoccus parkwayensis]|uniref:ATP-grasp domain-containing protein n=1 Tax=Pyxidicoccus parkwayensis TaxID=2813578 RepID=A0ABX7NQ10_9BACT|nr:ATP-grasp domain-containing protein [Pyxidicoccus parkwaysis]QSQ20937.1 ATP-grasp domain-containing protein [Pyxidicoccus parkwaysis]